MVEERNEGGADGGRANGGIRDGGMRNVSKITYRKGKKNRRS